MTVPAMHPRPGNLRTVAEQIESATGLRVEILGGNLVISPTPRGKHAGTIRRLQQQIEARIPDGLATYEVTSLALAGDPDDYCTPDLVILPDAWDEDDEWLAEPTDVELAVEVISQSEKSRQITDKNGWYSVAGVRLLLVVDPRFGKWTLYSHPRNDSYHGELEGEYGVDIPLPKPFAFSLDTGCLPRYA